MNRESGAAVMESKFSRLLPFPQARPLSNTALLYAYIWVHHGPVLSSLYPQSQHPQIEPMRQTNSPAKGEWNSVCPCAGFFFVIRNDLHGTEVVLRRRGESFPRALDMDSRRLAHVT